MVSTLVGDMVREGLLAREQHRFILLNQAERRSKSGERVILRERILRRDRRAGAQDQPVALFEHFLRRRQRLEQAA